MTQLPTLKAKWFWYSILCLVCWVPWVLFAKLGSVEIPSRGMQFLFTLGGVPVALALLIPRRFHLEKSGRGIFYGLMVGILSAIGTLALFGAYRAGGNASVITTATSLYPMVTVILAVAILHERLTIVQIVGLGFATAAIVIFSL